MADVELVQHRGLSPADRPTEWTTALVMLAVAVAAYNADRDVAALVSVVAACLPVIVSAIATWWERRKATVKAS